MQWKRKENSLLGVFLRRKSLLGLQLLGPKMTFLADCIRSRGIWYRTAYYHYKAWVLEITLDMDKNNEDKSDEMECFRNYTALLNYCHKTEPCPRVGCLYSLEYCSWSAYTNSLTYAFLNYCIDGSPSSEIKNIYWNVVYFFYQIHTLMAFYLKNIRFLCQ